MRPALAEYARSLGRLPAVITQLVRQCMLDPGVGAWKAAVGPLGRLLPTALFDNRPLQDYFALLFNSAGHTDDSDACARGSTWSPRT